MAVAVWLLIACVMIVPVAIAMASPLHAYRSVVYSIGGMAGVVALALLLIQPLLAAGYLPGATALRGRRWHRLIGAGLIIAIALHIGGLYLTSPPDTLDALLLVSPTPFSVYGVIGLWSLLFTVVLVMARRRIGLSAGAWRIAHNALAAVVVVSSVVHALLIEGTMGAGSKIILSVSVLAVTAAVILHLRVLNPILKKRRSQ